ncbi:MAG: pantoate--beta-alanine ligase [Rhodospirillaceae bacterium]|nr:pantoate--beta-alanine ligase [Rhodospirillaceae bacterium]
MTIKIFRTSSELAAQVGAWRNDGKKIGLVPTMGALHAGHMALVHRAKKVCDKVCVTLFVNPTQFGEGEDFNSYPRDEEKDCAMLQDAGADILYAPTVAEMYPNGTTATLSAGKLGNILEGTFRPGHFDGVATVVERLFSHTNPHVAFFGEKDYQQLQVIKQMTIKQKIGVEIVGVPTVRGDDGLALSSRNEYLTAAELALAPTLHQTLQAVAGWFVDGEDMPAILARATEALEKVGFGPVDYVAVVDATTLEPLKTYSAHVPARVLVAAKLGRARLIDNIAVTAP